MNRIITLLEKEKTELSAGQPKYVSLKILLQQVIEKNSALEGEKMPSTRFLADFLGVSRSTVNRAYELLMFENFIEVKKSSSYSVRHTKGSPKSLSNIEANINFAPLSKSAENFLSNVHILNSTSDKEIAFRPGLPPLDVFPIDIWRRLYDQYWKNSKAASLTYHNASGLAQLKKNIAYYLRVSRGISVHEDQVMIVAGSLQSLFLVGTALINEGDDVVIENPTFPNVHSIFKSLGAKIFPAPVDEGGMLVDEIPESIKPKLIHVTPSNHYPTGAVLSPERRRKLLEYASQSGAFIIENDYDHEISNFQTPQPSLFELDTEGRVIFLGTFNRLLHPSVRLGYMVLPIRLLDAVKSLQKHSHRFVSPSGQVVLSEFIRKDFIFKHIQNVFNVYVERDAIFQRLLGDYLPEFRIHTSAAPSLHLLVKMPATFEDKHFAEYLKNNGVLTHAYSNTFIENPRMGLIFGHISLRRHLMEAKIMAMANAYREFIGD